MIALSLLKIKELEEPLNKLLKLIETVNEKQKDINRMII